MPRSRASRRLSAVRRKPPGVPKYALTDQPQPLAVIDKLAGVFDEESTPANRELVRSHRWVAPLRQQHRPGEKQDQSADRPGGVGNADNSQETERERAADDQQSKQ